MVLKWAHPKQDMSVTCFGLFPPIPHKWARELVLKASGVTNRHRKEREMLSTATLSTDYSLPGCVREKSTLAQRRAFMGQPVCVCGELMSSAVAWFVGARVGSARSCLRVHA